MTRIARTLLATAAAAALVLAPTAFAGGGAHQVGDVADPGLGEQVVPLAGEKPAWLTPDLEAQVVAANGLPVAAPNDAPLPGSVGIRPGSWMVSPAGCTMNFVFAKSGDLAIGTAGHCAAVGDDVVLLTLAPGGGNPVLVNIGKVSISRDNGIGDDFALVPIRSELHPWVSATKAIWGGPCGQYGGSAVQGVFHYGHGLAIGTGGTPRGGVGLYFESDAFYWTSPAIFGDSGSAVRITDLRAAGNLTHLVIDLRRPGAVVAGTTIAKMEMLAGSWTMVDSPLCLGGAGSEPGGGDGGGGDDGGGNGGGNGGGPPDGKGPPNR